MRRVLARSTPFSYACGGCGRCCHGKRITLTPYELARLAAARRTTTRAILEQHTDESGTALRFGDAGCTFLEEGRCSVHAGRPLACRLYPLGRYVRPDGFEAFVEIEPHPETVGTYGEDGTVEGWVEAQGAGPYLRAAEKTFAAFERLLAAAPPEAVSEALATTEPVASEWLDVDAIVARACEEKKMLAPLDVEERYAIYLAALDRFIAGT